MSAHVADLRAQRDRALAKADEILSAAERGKRNLTVNESQTVKACTAQAADLRSEIDRVESSKNARTQLENLRAQIPQSRELNFPQAETLLPKKLSASYVRGFLEYGSSKGKQMRASLTEGTDVLGGFAVPSLVADDQYVGLAPSDLTIRKLAKVIVTTSDLKIPSTSVLPTAAVKTEGGSFSVSSSTVGQFTISAFLVGAEADASMEIFQDAPIFMAAVGDDLALAVQELEENYYLTGTGSGQAQGLLGNVGAGITGAVADGLGNLLSIDSTFNVLSTLKDRYHPNASFVMQRASAIELRLAQKQSGLFEPVFTRDLNGQDRLHGYPVYYSASMPAIAAGATPVLFGSFRDGYLIADRGSSAVFLKVIDQDATKAILGLIPILGYRRSDGRVRRSEAIQGITLHT